MWSWRSIWPRSSRSTRSTILALDIQENSGPFEHEGVVQECFLVEMSRREDDPVTEPIAAEDVKWTIAGTTITARRPGFDWIWPGEGAFTFHLPTAAARKAGKWSAQIGQEPL